VLAWAASGTKNRWCEEMVVPAISMTRIFEKCWITLTKKSCVAPSQK
jgi:hypothetical protein